MAWLSSLDWIFMEIRIFVNIVKKEKVELQSKI